jgi:hypothetical protein
LRHLSNVAQFTWVNRPNLRIFFSFSEREQKWAHSCTQVRRISGPQSFEAPRKNNLKEIQHFRRRLFMRNPLLKTVKTQLRVLLLITASVLPLKASQPERLTAEERALVDKGAFMEMYKPDEHSRHFIAHIDSVTDPKTKKASKTANNPQAVVCFVFGIEDAEPARKEGRSMAEFHYSPSQAHDFLFAQGWDKYHDRFFTRCYVQEGEAAYDKAVETQQKHVDQSSSS